MPRGFSGAVGLSSLFWVLLLLESRSNTAFALLNLDTLLAVLLRLPAALRNGDVVVEPFILLLLPLDGDPFSRSLLLLLLLPCIAADETTWPFELRRSMDMA